MDDVGFRTLGGGAARDAKLGARPHERHGDNGLAGGDGAWGSDLGFGCRNSRNKLYLAWSIGSVLHEPASGPSAFDQLCRKPPRERFRRFIHSCRTKRGDADSTQKRIARSLMIRRKRFAPSPMIREKHRAWRLGELPPRRFSRHAKTMVRIAPSKYAPGTKPGEYRSTPPDFMPAAKPHWGGVTSFVLKSSDASALALSG
jgi:hypothetical protein